MWACFLQYGVCSIAYPYTLIIEHKHFEFGVQPQTVITKEYPIDWYRGNEPYYTANDDCNNTIYQKYKELAEKEEKIIFGGRLGEYRYYDMDQVIDAALKVSGKELNTYPKNC